MLTSRRDLLAGLAVGLPLAACGKSPITLDPTTINIEDLIRNGTRAFCGLLPTGDTIAQIVLALALPAGLPVEQIASQAAHAFCDQAAPVVKARQARGLGRRGIEPSTGRPVTNYGPVIINGKPVNVTVYE